MDSGFQMLKSVKKKKKKGGCSLRRQSVDSLNGGLINFSYGREAKKKVGAHFYSSTGAFFIASVDLPFKESSDPGLRLPFRVSGSLLSFSSSNKRTV